jgi:hypothetical protein
MYVKQCIDVSALSSRSLVRNTDSDRSKRSNTKHENYAVQALGVLDWVA